MSGIEITRSEFTASDLRMAAGKSRDAKAARRMLALALVLEGVDRTRAAQTCGMDRQTLRDWVHRYNAEGLAGLSDRRKGVRVPRLVPAQMADLAAWVEAGPDPEKDGVVRWRRQDLQRRIAEAFGAGVHERTVGKYLAALGYRRLSVRPQHPRTDPGAQETFKKTSARQERRRPPRPRKAGPSKSGSRMKRVLVNRARSPVSGPSEVPDPVRLAIPAINGRSPVLSNRWRSPAHLLARSARRVVRQWASCCPLSALKP